MPTEKPGLSPTLKAIIGEAAGEGAEGMLRVAKVIQTRAHKLRRTTDQVVLQPHQFSAMARPDLDAFVAQQGPGIAQQAQAAMTRAASEVTPQTPYATHYLTHALYQDPTHPSWVNKMKVVERYGHHVFLSE